MKMATEAELSARDGVTDAVASLFLQCGMRFDKKFFHNFKMALINFAEETREDFDLEKDLNILDILASQLKDSSTN